MAKKPAKQPERIRCADCVHGKPTDWRFYDTIYTERFMRARQASQGSGRMVRDIEHRKGSERPPVL